MEKNRVRKRSMMIRFTDDELQFLKEKMDDAGFSNNREAYLRKMAMNGYVIKQDFAGLSDVVYQLSRIGNNLNQMTRIANTHGDIELSELKEIKKGIDQIWQLLTSKA